MIAEKAMYSPLVHLDRLRSAPSLTHTHDWLWGDVGLILTKANVSGFVRSRFKRLVHLDLMRKLADYYV